MSLLDLPDELIIDIAERLVSEYKHRSLAVLNQANRRLRDATVSTLYRIVILFRTDHDRLEEHELLEPMGEGDPVPEAWKHTR
jgi:hypothetical protein